MYSDLITKFEAAVAQLGSTPTWGAGGRWFDSGLPDFRHLSFDKAMYAKCGAYWALGLIATMSLPWILTSSNTSRMKLCL